MEGILTFLREGRFKSFALSRLWLPGYLPRSVNVRLVILYGLLKHYFSLDEAVLLFLPGRFRSNSLQKKFWDFLNKEAKKELQKFLNADGTVELFTKAFLPPQLHSGEYYYYQLGIFLLEVIVYDQYHAQEYLEEGMIVIDAGANIGTFSIYAAERKAFVYSFEPSPGIFNILKKNINPYPKISAFNMGLGDVPAHKLLHGTTLEDSGMKDETPGVGVPITTIDIFVGQNNIPRVDFIKMDTEGYEAKILSGAKETIAKYRPVIVMSAYHHPDDEKKLPALLHSFVSGYVCELKKEYEADLVCYPVGD